MINFVTKRDGTQQPYEVSKIRFAINEACQGLDVDTLALEAKVSNNFSDGVTTTQIQSYLVQTARQLITAEEPEWSKVAGRLAVMNLWKETINFRGYGYDDYFKHLTLMTSPKYLQSHTDNLEESTVSYYDPKILDLYTVEEIVEAGSWIVKDRDLLFDHAGISTLMSKNLIKVKNNSEGLCAELPQEVYLTIALFLASVEKPEFKMEKAKEFYDSFSELKLSPATPFLKNLRTLDGNLSSCFTLSVGDSLKSIDNAWGDSSFISKNGGGIGKGWSRVRAQGSTIKGVSGLSGGILPWIKIDNGIAVAVNQLGLALGHFS